MPKASVVIPTYNRPDHLPGAIETVLDQELDDTEVIVVDDGSETSYARSIVEGFPSQVRCLEHQNNRGLSAARNTGIQAAKSEYIGFLDDDDRWHETKLPRQIRALEAHHDAGLATCCVASVTPDGSVLRCERSKPDGDLHRRILRRNVIGSPSRVLVTRDCLDDVGTFDEDLRTKQDWDFYIRLSQDWNVVCVDEPLVYRTVHESMSSGAIAAERDNARVIAKHRDRIERAGLEDETMAAYYANVGRTFLEQGDVGQARQWLWKALGRKSNLWYLVMFGATLGGRNAFATALSVKRSLERDRYCPEWLDPTGVANETPGARFEHLERND